jgi:hypothetical protein
LYSEKHFVYVPSVPYKRQFWFSANRFRENNPAAGLPFPHILLVYPHFLTGSIAKIFPSPRIMNDHNKHNRAAYTAVSPPNLLVAVVRRILPLSSC